MPARYLNKGRPWGAPPSTRVTPPDRKSPFLRARLSPALAPPREGTIGAPPPERAELAAPRGAAVAYAFMMSCGLTP